MTPLVILSKHSGETEEWVEKTRVRRLRYRLDSLGGPENSTRCKGVRVLDVYPPVLTIYGVGLRRHEVFQKTHPKSRHLPLHPVRRGGVW